MKIFISSAWIRDDVHRLETILNKIDGIEVNSIGNGKFSSELYDFAMLNGLKISSIHASAGPHKIQDTAYYLPNIASTDRELREYDIKQLILTAEWASKIGVDRIVFHAGHISDELLKRMYIDYKEQFINNQDAKELLNLKQSIVNKREKLITPFIDSITEVIDRVCSSFTDIGFYMETRVNYYEIPTLEEAKKIILNLNHKNLGYWNDIGHSYIQNELELTDFNKWKTELNSYCGGLHIHDIDSHLKDHYPPGLGKAPLLNMLKGFPQDIPWVLEINSRHTSKEIIYGINYYKKLMNSLFAL